jgi:hypothetical protein
MGKNDVVVGAMRGHVWRKVVCLFVCLFGFVMLRSLLRSIVPAVGLLIPLESPWRGVVCRGGLAIFRPMVQELLNIEQILLKKIKINK